MTNQFHEGNLVRCVDNKRTTRYERYLLCGRVIRKFPAGSPCDLYVEVISRGNYEEMGSDDSGSNWYMDRNVLKLIGSIECVSPLAPMFE